jgi:hypothetical protein
MAGQLHRRSSKSRKKDANIIADLLPCDPNLHAGGIGHETRRNRHGRSGSRAQNAPPHLSLLLRGFSCTPPSVMPLNRPPLSPR